MVVDVKRVATTRLICGVCLICIRSVAGIEISIACIEIIVRSAQCSIRASGSRSSRSPKGIIRTGMEV